MEFDATARRRWLGALALAGALGMLLLGETVLKERLGPLAALAYWLACLGLTTVAILMALLDVRAVQSRSRQEQRALFQDALKNIEAEARKRMPGNTGNNGRK